MHSPKVAVISLFLAELIVLSSYSYNEAISQVVAESSRVVLTFPSPGPSPRDLAWDGAYLWLTDDSTDTIYKLNPSNGEVILSFPSPGPEPKGLTWDGSHLWNSDDHYVMIFKLDPNSGQIAWVIPAPAVWFEVEEWVWRSPIKGLAWDGNYLWSAYFAGWSSKVNQVEPTDGRIVRSFFSAVEGMTSNGQYLWTVSYTGGQTTGKIVKRVLPELKWIASFDTPGRNPKGLAFDGEYFWHADCDTDSLYKIEVISTSVKVPNVDSKCLPFSFRLHQNFPNPFNLATGVSYELPFDSKVSLAIFNISGQLVKTLVDEEKKAGRYTVVWDGRNNFGQYVSSGIYLYQIKTERFSKIRKMTLTR